MGLDLYLADSGFNAVELAGVLPESAVCLVVPPFHQVERLLSVSADRRVLDTVPDDTPMLLSVGRVAPNKNHGALIDSVGFLNGPCRVPVRLAIVGGIDPAFGRYVAELHARIRRAGLSGRVEFLGKISDAQLKACYERAQILVTTSLHEGFCVPVVEAMAIGVPVVALAAGAVTETVGDAGLVWETPDPELFGASMCRILKDVRLHTALIARGEARFRSNFAVGVITEKFLGALRSVGLYRVTVSMKVAVCSPSVEAGDAVSNDILGELRCLSAMGIEARLFAHESLVPGLRADPVSNVQAFATSPDDLFLYHYAIGWDEALATARHVTCRIALKFHNVTPPAFFRGISPEYEHVCDAGLRQLRDWAALHPWKCIGDSQFNIDGLITAGADPASCTTCPPYSPGRGIGAF